MITLLSFYRGKCSDIQGFSLDERLRIGAKQWQEIDTLLPWLFPCKPDVAEIIGLSDREIRQFVFDDEATSGLYDMLRAVLPLFGITFWDSPQGYAAEVDADQLANAVIVDHCRRHLPAILTTLRCLGLGAQQQALMLALNAFAEEYADSANTSLLISIAQMNKQIEQE